MNYTIIAKDILSEYIYITGSDAIKIKILRMRSLGQKTGPTAHAHK